MIAYILQKLRGTLLTLWTVATLLFILMRLAPGNPFLDEHLLTEESLEAMQRHHGLDKPLAIQYLVYLKKLLLCDLGPSLHFDGIKVSTLIAQAFPYSLTLGSLAFFFAVFLGFFLSLFLVFSKSRLALRVAKMLNTSFLSTPSFIASALLQYLLAILWPIFPSTGGDSLFHLILPALSLALVPSGVIARLLKTKLEEGLDMPYTLSAKAKGISSFRLIVCHLLPGAILPTLAYLGPLAATFITGSFAVEKVFAIPGLGSWFVVSLFNRDYPMIAGLTLFYTFFVLGFSLIVDLLYMWLDPKLKTELDYV